MLPHNGEAHCQAFCVGLGVGKKKKDDIFRYAPLFRPRMPAVQFFFFFFFFENLVVLV